MQVRRQTSVLPTRLYFPFLVLVPCFICSFPLQLFFSPCYRCLRYKLGLHRIFAFVLLEISGQVFSKSNHAQDYPNFLQATPRRHLVKQSACSGEIIFHAYWACRTGARICLSITIQKLIYIPFNRGMFPVNDLLKEDYSLFEWIVPSCSDSSYAVRYLGVRAYIARLLSSVFRIWMRSNP